MYNKYKTKILNIARCVKIYFSKYKYCQSISLSSVDVLYLSCEQEEADTRILCHYHNILNIQKDADIVTRSPSDDTDFIIISVSLLNQDHILNDNAAGKNINCLQIDKMKINEQEQETLVGFHVITRNDCISSFFGKGKRKCCGKMISSYFFMKTVQCLGPKCYSLVL